MVSSGVGARMEEGVTKEGNGEFWGWGEEGREW